MSEREPIQHILKCRGAYFDAIRRGEKNFEIRRDDRGFQCGDILILQRLKDGSHDVEWSDFCNTPIGQRHPARHEMRLKVKWILTGGQFGLEAGYVCMAIEREVSKLCIGG